MNHHHHKIRESWLVDAVHTLNRKVFIPAGYEVPDDTKVTCGWPSRGAIAKRKTLGECWPRSRSAKNINEIFLSPTMDDAVDVLGVLVHELVHAIDDCKHGHKAPFRKIAVAVGLEGKMTSTVAGDALTAKLEAIQDALGDYPHAELTPPPPKQKSRQLKLECNDCGAVWRMSNKWLSLATCCPCCQSENIESV